MKLAGYTLAARYISREYEKRDRSAWIVGVTRTVIGMFAGTLYFGGIKLMTDLIPNASGFLYLSGLVPVRVAEWWFLIWLFYDRKFERGNDGWRIVLLATVWSYVIDIPAIGGLIITGGLWIC